MDEGLGERLFKFSVTIIQYLRKIRSTEEISVIKYQLTKAATSSGANYEEAQSASSRADFKYKMNISLREMRESNYWLRIMEAIKIGNLETSNKLVHESNELKKILGAICIRLGT